MKTNLSTNTFNKEIEKQPISKQPKRIKMHRKVTEPIDKGNPQTAIIRKSYCTIMPTPFEDCFEKMSFEEPVKDNMWRDAQYDDNFERTFYDDEVFAPHIIYEQPYIPNYYSYDDIPIADSIIRNKFGLKNIADAELDFCTYMDSYDAKILDQINYNENIFPSVLHNIDYIEQEEFSSAAAAYKQEGYAQQTILSAAERCHLKDNKSKHGIPDIKLFEFLIENPNFRSLVVAKDKDGREFLDKTCMGYFKIFSKYLPDKIIKSTLELCKTEINEIQLVDQNLCDVVILTRQRSVQNKKDSNKNIDNTYYETPIRKLGKYVDKNTEFSEQDIKLIKKLKPNNKLDISMCEAVKYLLSYENMPVETINKNINKYETRKKEINKTISVLKEKSTYNDIASIDAIKKILDKENKNLLMNAKNTKAKSIFLDTTKNLIDKETSIQNINILLNSLKDINKKVPINEEFVDKYINLLNEKNDNEQININQTIVEILTELVLISNDISDIDYEIISLLKESQNEKLITLVENKLKRTSDKDEILSLIKEKTVSNKTITKTKELENINELIEEPSNKIKLNEQSIDELNFELAKIHKRLDKLNSVSAEIIKTIQKCDREKQQELIELVNEMLDKWYTNQAILTAVQKQACTK